VLVIDETDRLLLFRASGDMGDVWITPGGALEPGESAEDAARRELWEETGIAGVALGPCVWTRTHLFTVDGRAYAQGERFYVARVSIPAVTLENIGAAERPFISAWRWWTVEDITASPAVFAPRSLGSILPAIIAGAYPPEPLDLPD
jgi:8-oxo-dGTP pyrophosphatase MutT (NUDIX family)